jgi:hypothetical protein
MGTVLRGASSKNIMTWARGHRQDWEYLYSEAKDERWNYESVLGLRLMERPCSLEVKAMAPALTVLNYCAAVT